MKSKKVNFRTCAILGSDVLAEAVARIEKALKLGYTAAALRHASTMRKQLEDRANDEWAEAFSRGADRN